MLYLREAMKIGSALLAVAKKTEAAADALDAAMAEHPVAFNEQSARKLQCDSSTLPEQWHPSDNQVGWSEGYCQFTRDCNSPGYATELACCKGEYDGQTSGACLAQLPHPPTTSPTWWYEAGEWYAMLDPNWAEGTCVKGTPASLGFNEGDKLSYSSQLACCKGEYDSQTSGACLAQLPHPPTTSPTWWYETGEWYAMLDPNWAEGTCVKGTPASLGFNEGDKLSYSSQLACCKGEYDGQTSGACLAQLPHPPTTSPTIEEGKGTIEEGKGTTNNGNTESVTVIPAKLEIANVDCHAKISSGSALETTIEATLKAELCKAVVGECKVKILKIIIQGCARRERHNKKLRALSSHGTLVAEVEVLITTYCQTSNCSDLLTIANAIYDQVSADLEDAIQTGTLVTALRSNTSSALDAFNAATGATVSIGTLVNAVLAVLGDWYPDWHGGIETCKNDGKAPLYMRRTRSFIKDSLESCCLAYYSWDMTNCMILGGADASAYVTNEFYVDYASDSCKQSCLEASATATLNCGGLIPSWKTPYKTAEECCKTKLFWVNENSCVSKSTGGSGTTTTPTGSGDWYVNWQSFKCVTDCPKANGGDCGGLANSWDILYSSASACCSTHLSWLDTSKQRCT